MADLKYRIGQVNSTQPESEAARAQQAMAQMIREMEKKELEGMKSPVPAYDDMTGERLRAIPPVIRTEPSLGSEQHQRTAEHPHVHQHPAINVDWRSRVDAMRAKYDLAPDAGQAKSEPVSPTMEVSPADRMSTIREMANELKAQGRAAESAPALATDEDGGRPVDMAVIAVKTLPATSRITIDIDLRERLPATKLGLQALQDSLQTVSTNDEPQTPGVRDFHRHCYAAEDRDRIRKAENNLGLELTGDPSKAMGYLANSDQRDILIKGRIMTLNDAAHTNMTKHHDRELQEQPGSEQVQARHDIERKLFAFRETKQLTAGEAPSPDAERQDFASVLESFKKWREIQTGHTASQKYPVSIQKEFLRYQVHGLKAETAVQVQPLTVHQKIERQIKLQMSR